MESLQNIDLMVLVNIIIAFFFIIFIGLFLVSFVTRLQALIKFQLKSCSAITWIFLNLYVSVWCKYHQVLFHAVRNFYWDVFVTKIWILYCKVVTNLFTGIKEHVLGDNVVTKYIQQTKTRIASITPLLWPAAPYVLMIHKLNLFDSCWYKANGNLFLNRDEALSLWIHRSAFLTSYHRVLYRRWDDKNSAFQLFQQ